MASVLGPQPKGVGLNPQDTHWELQRPATLELDEYESLSIANYSILSVFEDTRSACYRSAQIQTCVGGSNSLAIIIHFAIASTALIDLHIAPESTTKSD